MSADPVAVVLLTLGGIFLAGLVADLLGRYTRLPRVTLLLILGVAVGPLGLDIFPESSAAWVPLISDMALVMVAFLLGGALTPSLLRQHGREVFIISLVVVAVTLVFVSAGLFALGWPAPVALLLGAIATSTDPVAVSDVVRETKADGPFTRTLVGIVAVDDAWGIVAMSLSLVLVLAMQSSSAAGAVAFEGLRDLGGAVLVGCAVGVPMALLSGRVRDGEPTLAEALGGVMLCGGIALHFHVSFLLSAMTMGAIVANFARHHRRPFRAIEGIEWPFMVLFFVLSGASLQVDEMGTAGMLTLGYVVLRLLARLAGGWLGACLAGPSNSASMAGAALLPQAGIAIGMALVASQRIPELGTSILGATIAGTVVFELFGPILTRAALVRSGEARTC